MTASLGQVALILALCVATIQGAMPLWGAYRQNTSWMAVGWSAALAQCLLLALALFFLGDAFVNSDFSLRYVAQHSNLALPTLYKVAAIWGGHEGSILLWVFLLSAWGLAFSLATRHQKTPFNARILAISGLTSIGFLLFIVFTSNPFDTLQVVPRDGADLNPLLQDPAFIIHPPMLYMGYVGFSIAFAAAIAALLEGRIETDWADQIRSWTLAAWSFLTVGISLGSWWAYYELGWGGWWFWDPVENASLMPWLAGTALIHSMFALQRQGLFQRTVILLSITSFSLSLLGTFLVRSGVLTSVHAFASDPERGLFILLFLAVVTGSSFLLYAIRAQHLPRVQLSSIWARETLLSAGNLFLLVALATVMLGTLYPLVLDAFQLGKISVGPPYFNTVMVPIMALVVMLMAITPKVRWQNQKSAIVRQAILIPFVCGIILVIGVIMILGAPPWASVLGLFLCGSIVGSMSHALLQRIRSSGPKPTAGWWGMFTAHIGAAVFIAGVALSSAFSLETEQQLEPGEAVQLGEYRFQFNGVHRQAEVNYVAFRGDFEVSRNGAAITQLFPEKRLYQSSGNPMTEAAIDSTLSRDLYIALGNRGTGINRDAWSVRLYVKPFLSLLWLGVSIIALGGFTAAGGFRLIPLMCNSKWFSVKVAPEQRI